MFAPINTGFADNGGRPSLRLVRFHRDRSSDAIGINFVGNVAVDRDATTNHTTVVLSNETDVARLAVVARAIARRGSLAGIQLASSPRELSPSRRWRAASLEHEVARLRSMIAGLDSDDLRANLASFLRAARLSVRAGFSAIQVHAAHGYLLSLLLHPTTNHRRDRYSADGKWFGEFIEEMADATDGRLLSVRLNAIYGIGNRDEEIDSFLGHAVTASRAGADIIDISAGAYTVDRRLIYPNRGDGPLPHLSVAHTVLGATSALVAVAGNVWGEADVPSDLPERLLVNVGRSLIADPLFALRAREGDFGAINPCRRTGQCHYFSRGERQISCGSNRTL